MTTHYRIPIPVVVILLASFGRGALAQNRGPDLILLDSLVLTETDEHYIGNPVALFVAHDGSLLVSDAFAETVFRYDAAGRLLARWGRRGQGPGEFRNLGGVGFVAADVAGFLDETGKLELFALANDAHHGTVRMDVTDRPSSFAVKRDSLWFAGINPVSSTTYGVVAMEDLVNAANSDERTPPLVLDRGSVPAPYAENHGLARTLSHAFLDVGDRDVVLGFTASPFLIRTDYLGDAVDTVWFAPGRRRGQPDEAKLIELMRGDRPRSQEALRSWMFDFFSSVTFVRDLSRDDAGHIYTVHQDRDHDEKGTTTGVRLYALVSRFDGHRGCGDTLIPTSDMGAPVPFLQGSTLWVLDRRVNDGATPNIVTVVRRFMIDAGHCTGTIR